jgi:hypothetical protein
VEAPDDVDFDVSDFRTPVCNGQRRLDGLIADESALSARCQSFAISALSCG